MCIVHFSVDKKIKESPCVGVLSGGLTSFIPLSFLSPLLSCFPNLQTLNRTWPDIHLRVSLHLISLYLGYHPTSNPNTLYGSCPRPHPRVHTVINLGAYTQANPPNAIPGDPTTIHDWPHRDAVPISYSCDPRNSGARPLLVAQALRSRYFFSDVPHHHNSMSSR